MVSPKRVASVVFRARKLLRAISFELRMMALVEADADADLASEPTYTALAAAVRSVNSSLPPLVQAFKSANL